MEHQEHHDHHYHFHVGMRNLKSALSAALVALVYILIGRDPTFACIGAVYGMGNDLGHSWKQGGNRIIGTVIGGFLGMGLFWIFLQIDPTGSRRNLLLVPFIFIGVVILICLAQAFHWPTAVQPGSVVLSIILFMCPVETYVSYSLNRMLDTAVGVIASMVLNLILPRERLEKWKNAVTAKKAA